jgi:hypothetical protein
MVKNTCIIFKIMVITFKKLFNLTFFFLAFAFFFSIFLTSAICLSPLKNALLDLNTSILQTSDSLNPIIAALKNRQIPLKISDSFIIDLDFHIRYLEGRIRFLESHLVNSRAIGDENVKNLENLLLTVKNNYLVLVNKINECQQLITLRKIK